jgi:hypothetical protein
MGGYRDQKQKIKPEWLHKWCCSHNVSSRLAFLLYALRVSRKANNINKLSKYNLFRFKNCGNKTNKEWQRLIEKGYCGY